MIALLTSSAFAAPPSQLFEKSVTVSWGENRTQRELELAGQPMRHVSNSIQWTVYISSAGRTFVRQHRTSDGGGRRGRLAQNTRERAPGDGPAPGNQAAKIDFNGTTMMQTSIHASGARQIVVDFDSGFGSCNARVIQGKEGGKHQILTSQITGRKLEVHSVQVVSPRCSIRAGNVLAQ